MGTETGKKGASDVWIAIEDGEGPVNLMVCVCGTNANMSWRDSAGTDVITGAEKGRGGEKSEGMGMEQIELSREECGLERIAEGREGGKMSRMIRRTEGFLRNNGGGRGVGWGEEVSKWKKGKLRAQQHWKRPQKILTFPEERKIVGQLNAVVIGVSGSMVKLDMHIICTTRDSMVRNHFVQKIRDLTLWGSKTADPRICLREFHQTLRS